uniref:Uncharacterized protein n=1 Tax=Megaselia scalaris TaxID=36166 RepID=T1GFA0_MEGSC
MVPSPQNPSQLQVPPEGTKEKKVREMLEFMEDCNYRHESNNERLQIGGDLYREMNQSSKHTIITHQLKANDAEPYLKFCKRCSVKDEESPKSL